MFALTPPARLRSARPPRPHVTTPPAMRVLITAGNTRERIDDVRDWGNIFTGNTGFSIARALSQHVDVDLVTSNRQHLAEKLPASIQGHAFTSHADLKAVLD